MKKPINPLKKIFYSGLPWLWIATLVIIIDRYSKYWVMENLMPLEPLKILPIFNLTLAFNKGAAFNFLHSASGWQNLFFSSFAFIISIGILFWLYKITIRDYWLNIALCLIFGGALGNVWDRILYGYVVDFLNFHLGNWHFAIFNIADSAICVGASMLFFYWLKPHPAPLSS